MDDRDSWISPASAGEPAALTSLLPPVLPGLAPRRRLGRGPDAPWVARADDGAWVVVRRGRPPVELPEHPALLPVIGQVHDSSGAGWVITPYRSGSGLDRRLERVGRLAPGFVRAVATVARNALGALHQAGLAHTDLDPSRILLGTRDEVVLEATCARPGSAADQQADLDRLADLLDQLGDEPASLHRPRHARTAGVGRVLGGGTVVGVLLVAAAVLGVRLAERPSPTAALDAQVPVAEEQPVAPPSDPTSSTGPGSPAPDPDPRATGADAETDWVAVLQALDRARGVAFATADPALLAAVDAPGTTAMRRDTALVEALRDGGVVAEHWATRLLSVRPLRIGSDAVRLAVTDRMASYLLRAGDGRVVERRPARPAHQWTIRLLRTEDGWRVASVR